MNKVNTNRIDIIIIFCLIAIGGFLRFFLITKVPCGLFPDQARYGLDSLRFSEGFISPVYRGREGLYMYLLALSHFFFGTGIWQIFIVTAAIGTATVVVTYLAAKEFFTRQVAFLSAFVLAVSGWHIALSRDGFRANLVPLLISLFAYFLGKSINSKNEKEQTIYYTVTAAVFALGFYTYNAYLIFAFSVFLIFALLIIQNRSFVIKNKKKLFYALAAFSVVILPIALFVFLFPEEYFARAGKVSIFAQSLTFIGTVKLFLKNFWHTLWGVFTTGDLNWRHNPAGQPLLYPLLAPFFLTTLLYAFFKRGRYLILVFVYFMMFLPAILTNEGTPPHGLRLIGTIPFVFVIPGISLHWLLNFKQKYLRISGYLLVGLILISAAVSGYRNYFNEAPYSARYYFDFRCDLPKVTAIMRQEKDIEVIADKFSFQTLRYLLYPAKINQQIPEDFIKNFRQKNLTRKKFVVVSSFGHFNQEVVELLSKYLRKETIKNQFGGIDYYIFYPR